MVPSLTGSKPQKKWACNSLRVQHWRDCLHAVTFAESIYCWVFQWFSHGTEKSVFPVHLLCSVSFVQMIQRSSAHSGMEGLPSASVWKGVVLSPSSPFKLSTFWIYWKEGTEASCMVHCTSGAGSSSPMTVCYLTCLVLWVSSHAVLGYCSQPWKLASFFIPMLCSP